MGTQLALHKGSRAVSRGELLQVPAPPSTETWFPIAHGDVLLTVERLLFEAGFRVQREQFGLGKDNARFFGTLDLESQVVAGVTLSVGVRNSIDKTFPLGFCAGHRVFVCDNLAFRSELLVTRKHTLNGGKRFQEAIALAVKALSEFKDTEAVRIGQMQLQQIEDMTAEALMLRAWEQKIVSHQTLPRVLRAWRTPEHAEFEQRTLWALFNAFTLALGPRAQRNPQQFARDTMSLHELLDPNQF